MNNAEELKKLGINPVSGGHTREWVRCKKCRKVYFRDYLPFSIGNPITWLPCGHSIGNRFHDSIDVVTETQAVRALKKQLKGKK